MICTELLQSPFLGKQLLKTMTSAHVHTCRKQQEHLTVANCLITARQLRLHLGGPSKRIVEVFTTANPW